MRCRLIHIVKHLRVGGHKGVHFEVAAGEGHADIDDTLGVAGLVMKKAQPIMYAAPEVLRGVVKANGRRQTTDSGVGSSGVSNEMLVKLSCRGVKVAEKASQEHLLLLVLNANVGKELHEVKVALLVIVCRRPGLTRVHSHALKAGSGSDGAAGGGDGVRPWRRQSRLWPGGGGVGADRGGEVNRSGEGKADPPVAARDDCGPVAAAKEPVVAARMTMVTRLSKSWLPGRSWW